MIKIWLDLNPVDLGLIVYKYINAIFSFKSARLHNVSQYPHPSFNMNISMQSSNTYEQEITAYALLIYLELSDLNKPYLF